MPACCTEYTEMIKAQAERRRVVQAWAAGIVDDPLPAPTAEDVEEALAAHAPEIEIVEPAEDVPQPAEIIEEAVEPAPKKAVKSKP